MRAKKRYVLLRNYPRELPSNSKFLFQNRRGFVIRTDLAGADLLRKHAVLISGSIWKLKDPQLLNPTKPEKPMG